MTEADVEKLRVLTQFVLAEHVKHFDAAGHGGADEEFVSFGCEFDALASALGVESVEKPRRIGGNVEYNDAVVVGPQCSGNGHFAVGVKGKALGTIGHLLDDSVDDGFFQRQICKENVGVISYFSLASGFLTGKYRNEQDISGRSRGPAVQKYLNADGFRVISTLNEIAEQFGAKIGQVAVAWLMARPSITAPIVSATNMEQLQELLDSAKLSLGEENINKIDLASAF